MITKLFSTLLFSFFLFSQTTSFAQEGDIERLVVPEAQEETVTSDESDVQEEAEQEVAQEEIAQEESEVMDEPTHLAQLPQTTNEHEQDKTHTEESTNIPTEPTQEEVVEEVPEEITVEEAPSEDELEAKRAEEAELREVGAGEEPMIE